MLNVKQESCECIVMSVSCGAANDGGTRSGISRCHPLSSDSWRPKKGLHRKLVEFSAGSWFHIIKWRHPKVMIPGAGHPLSYTTACIFIKIPQEVSFIRESKFFILSQATSHRRNFNIEHELQWPRSISLE